jgi:hypothetical protein
VTTEDETTPGEEAEGGDGASVDSGPPPSPQPTVSYSTAASLVALAGWFVVIVGIFATIQTTVSVSEEVGSGFDTTTLVTWAKWQPVLSAIVVVALGFLLIAAAAIIGRLDRT